MDEADTERDAPSLRPRFPLDPLVMTPGALLALTAQQVLLALARHSRGVWGEVDAEDRQANDRTLQESGRLLSAYWYACGKKFWNITEADRSATTVLLPEGH